MTVEGSRVLSSRLAIGQTIVLLGRQGNADFRPSERLYRSPERKITLGHLQLGGSVGTADVEAALRWREGQSARADHLRPPSEQATQHNQKSRRRCRQEVVGDWYWVAEVCVCPRCPAGSFSGFWSASRP